MFFFYYFSRCVQGFKGLLKQNFCLLYGFLSTGSQICHKSAAGAHLLWFEFFRTWVFWVKDLSCHYVTDEHPSKLKMWWRGWSLVSEALNFITGSNNYDSMRCFALNTNDPCFIRKKFIWLMLCRFAIYRQVYFLIKLLRLILKVYNPSNGCKMAKFMLAGRTCENMQCYRSCLLLMSFSFFF